MATIISRKTLSELYKYLQANGGSYNELKNSFKHSDIEPDETIASTSTRNKDKFLDKYIQGLNLSQERDILKLIHFLELVIDFPPASESANLVDSLRQDGWQIIGNHIV